MLYKRCVHPDKSKCRCAWSYSFMLNGVTYRRSAKTANKQTAGRIEERRRVAILEGRDDEQSGKVLLLSAHIKDYVAHTAKTNATAHKDQPTLDRLLKVCGDIALKDVSPFHIEKWKQLRADAVSKSTVNRELHILRGCFARAFEWGRLKKSPLAAVRDYPVDDQRVRVLSDDELRRVLNDAPADVALICRVTLECLPRLSEVVGIHRDHIGPTWVEMRRKGGKVDRLAITSELREQLLSRGDGFLFGEGAKGQPPTEQAASLRVVRVLRKLGILNASHHTMRHTGVTLMLENGVNPRVIQKLAGWSSLRMLERYGHARDAEIVRAVSSNAAYLSALAASKPAAAKEA